MAGIPHLLVHRYPDPPLLPNVIHTRYHSTAEQGDISREKG